MAVQIIPEQGLGESLGAGLAQGLQGLAQLKAQDLMRRQQASYNVPLLQGLLPGIEGQQLQQMAMADPALLNQLIQRQTELQRGQMLAGLYGDPRLAGYTPKEIQAFVSSPQYQRQQVQQEQKSQAAPIIQGLVNLVSKRPGEYKITNFLGKMFGGSIDAINSFASQLESFKQSPELVGLGKALKGASTAQQRSDLLEGFIRSNPDTINTIGNAIASSRSQQQGLGKPEQDPFTGGQFVDQAPMESAQMIGQMQQAQLSPAEQAIASLTQRPKEIADRTAKQQLTGMVAEAAKAPAQLLELPENLANVLDQSLTGRQPSTSEQPELTQAQLDETLSKLSKDDRKLFLQQQLAKQPISEFQFEKTLESLPEAERVKVLQDELRKEALSPTPFSLKPLTQLYQKQVANIAEQISPGSTVADDKVGLTERIGRSFARGATTSGIGSLFGLANFGIGSLAADLAIAGTTETLADAGVGPLGQFVGGTLAGMITGKGAESLNRRLGRSVGQPVNEFKSKLYKEAEELGTKPLIKLNEEGAAGTGLLQQLDELLNEVSATMASSSQDARKKLLVSNIEAAQLKLQNALRKSPRSNYVTLNDAADLMKDINKTLVLDNSTYGKFSRKLRDTVYNFTVGAGKNEPKWLDAWQAANKLHSIQNWKSAFGSALTKLKGDKFIDAISNNPLTMSTIGFFSPKKILGTIGNMTLGKAVDRTVYGAKILNWVRNDPRGAELIADIIKASSMNDGGAIRNSLMAYNKFLGKNEERIKRQVGEAATLQPQQA